MISPGPIIFGLILGVLIGSQIRLKNTDSDFTIPAFIIILIAGAIVAWQSGNYPFYDDFGFSTALLSGLIGIFVGKIIFARGK